LHKVLPTAQLVLHLCIINSQSHFSFFWKQISISPKTKQPFRLLANEINKKDFIHNNWLLNNSCNKNSIPCSTTARIPSSEQIIAGNIREDEMLPTFVDLV